MGRDVARPERGKSRDIDCHRSICTSSRKRGNTKMSRDEGRGEEETALSVAYLS